jgi:hypothetical protein
MKIRGACSIMSGAYSACCFLRYDLPNAIPKPNIAPIPTASSPNSDLITILKESSFLPVFKFDRLFSVQALLKKTAETLVSPDIVPLPKKSPVFIGHPFMGW